MKKQQLKDNKNQRSIYDKIKIPIHHLPRIFMQKQLSKKSHKPNQSSIDDFMKHIRKYNLQSQRHISPKPLLYMYANPSRNFTLQTLQKSRSKSKTLSNRQYSKEKRSSSRTMRQKIQKMLSITKKQNVHKKSVSSVSNKNQKSVKKLNKSELEVTKSRQKLKDKFGQFKLKPMTASNKKTKKPKVKFDDHPVKIRQSSQIGSSLHQASQADNSHFSKDNPAQLIQMYSKKLFKAQLLLQSNKSKLGSMLCRKFQQILNEIVQCLVQNLKKSLNELQADIEKRLTRQYQRQFDRSMLEKEEEVRAMERVCEKMTRKFSEVLHKQHYSTSLIYSLRLRGVDVDHQFGRAVWGVDNLGGCGYGKSQEVSEDEHSLSASQQLHQRQLHQQNKLKNPLIIQSQSQDFEFRQHPNKLKQQQDQMKFVKRDNKLTMREQQQLQEQEYRMEDGEIIHRQKMSV